MASGYGMAGGTYSPAHQSHGDASGKAKGGPGHGQWRADGSARRRRGRSDGDGSGSGTAENETTTRTRRGANVHRLEKYVCATRRPRALTTQPSPSVYCATSASHRPQPSLLAWQATLSLPPGRRTPKKIIHDKHILTNNYNHPTD